MNETETPRTIRRRILKREWYTANHSRHNGGLALTLECGHEDLRKASQEPRGNFVRCKRCEDIRGGRFSMWPSEGTKEAWDDATQMPKIVPMTKQDYKI